METNHKEKENLLGSFTNKRTLWLVGAGLATLVLLLIIFCLATSYVLPYIEELLGKDSTILAPTFTLLIPTFTLLASSPVAYILWRFRTIDMRQNQLLQEQNLAITNVFKAIDFCTSPELNQRIQGVKQIGRLKNTFEWILDSDKQYYEGLMDLTNRKIDLKRADLTKAYLHTIDLSYASLSSANLTDAKLTNTNLTNAKLENAQLTSAKLTNANLTNANLTDANLTDANLTDANLTDAKLTNAKLTGANLEHANLETVDLSNASLLGANLTGANLTNANLTGAKASKRTIFPEGFDARAAGVEFVDDEN